MTPISPSALLERLQAFNAEQAIADAVEAEKVPLADMVRRQLSSGIAGDGKRLKPYKSTTYARKKNRMNPEPGLGNPDGKVSGALHEGIGIEAFRNGYGTTSKTPYAKYLEQRDGSRIYRLTDRNKATAASTLLAPHVIQSLAKATGLRIIR